MKEQVQKLEKVPVRITELIGTVGSLVAHTIFFAVALALPFFGFLREDVLLILTTVVSLEAIYLAIFIQMTVNRHADSIEEVQEDVQEISEDVEDISHDVEEISVDVNEMSEDVEEISHDVEEISVDVDEISEDVDKIHEEERQDNVDDERTKVTLEKIEGGLQKLLLDIEVLKRQKHDLDILKQNHHHDSQSAL